MNEPQGTKFVSLSINGQAVHCTGLAIKALGSGLHTVCVSSPDNTQEFADSIGLGSHLVIIRTENGRERKDVLSIQAPARIIRNADKSLVVVVDALYASSLSD